jgi:hypothetical protein
MADYPPGLRGHRSRSGPNAALDAFKVLGIKPPVVISLAKQEVTDIRPSASP